MSVRKPLAAGDDGSSNRYPVRSELPHCVRHNHHNCQSPACIGLPGAVADPRCSACVPAALQVPTPERFELPCQEDA